MKTFVSISCHDDLDVIPTVHDLFVKADHPADIRAVVILQTDRPELYNELQCEVHTFPLSWATGVGKPRSHAVKLIQDEEYFLQIDCHSRFQLSWDTTLKNEMELHPEKSVLSSLPPGFVIATGQLLKMENLIPKMHRFIENIPVSDFVPIPTDFKKPLRIPHILAGLLFCRISAIKEVPPDPHYHYAGEEFSQTLRWWTRGYDCYAIHACVLHHAYRGDNERPVTDNVFDVMKHWRSVQRISALIGNDRSKLTPLALIDIDKYELGDTRSIKSWEDTFSVDLIRQTFQETLR